MHTGVAHRALGASLSALLLLAPAAGAAGEKFAVFGGELTPPERQELNQLFGVNDAVAVDTVSTDELRADLRAAGLPVDESYRALSSSVLTCLGKGEGLAVRTQNITRIPAAAYANALVTAGVGDGSVLIAAPASRPLTGETALFGVLKAFPQCQGGQQPDQGRVQLAYEQVTRTADLAGQGGDLTKASNAMLKAAQPAITGQANDDAAVGAALDQAAAGEGLQVPQAHRGEIISFLKKLGSLDYGTYAKGYEIQQVNPNEVRVVPAGSGTPGAAAQRAAGAAAQPMAAGAALVGEVQRTGDTLGVRTADNQDRAVQPASNVAVTRDGRPAALADLRQGDRVTVATAPDGTAQRIDATSANDGMPSWWPWLLPLLLLPLLAGLLWGILGKRRRDSFILERSATSATQTPDRGALPRT